MQALPTNRIPGVDAVSELLAGKVQTGELAALHLGIAGDGTPIFAVGRTHSADAKTLLLIGAGSGDSVLGIAAACRFLVEDSVQFDDWNTWAICSLDIPRLRQNVSQLGQLKPSAKEHLLARRLPWGPGENPEHNLPISSEPYLQPDLYPEQEEVPEDVVASSPESLGLARALEHIQPDLVVSLKDRPAGGAFIACSQQLKSQDAQNLLEVLLGDLVGIHRAQPLHPGAIEPEQPGLVVLPLLEEQSESSAGIDDWQLGGASTWQALLLQNPDALYLAAFLPRLTHPDLSSELSSDHLSDVVLHTEVRNVVGVEKMVLVTKLNQPGHPAHDKEVRADVLSDHETPETGEFAGQPSVVGLVAAKAIWERQYIISKALESFGAALEHFETPEHQRALQILKNEHRQDNALRNFQTSKKYGVIATRAEAYYWNTVYRFQTAELLQEALRCIEGESMVDREIIKTRDVLQEWIGNQLIHCESLHSLPALELSSQMQSFIRAALAMVDQGGPTLVRAELGVDAAEKRLHSAQLKAKDSKAAGHPRAERQAALDAAEAAQYKLQLARELLENLQNGITPTLELKQETLAVEVDAEEAVDAQDELLAEGVTTTADTEPLVESVETQVGEIVDTPAKEETSETPDDLLVDSAKAQVAEIVDNPASEGLLVNDAVTQSSPELSPDNTQAPKAVPEPVESLPSVPVVEAPEQTPDAAEVPPPGALPPMPEASKPAPILVGDTQEPAAAINIEDLLPEKLEIPKEWGRGAMHWERQIPRMGEAPLMREMVNKLLAQGQSAAPKDPRASQSEIEEVKPVGNSLQEPSTPGTVAAAHTQSVGFVRHRVGADSRYVPSPIPPPMPLPNNGGVFQLRSQRRIEPNQIDSQ